MLAPPTGRDLPAFAIAAVVSILAAPCFGQQNLFNVPSGRITPHDQVFFQQQFNIGNHGLSNTTIDFGWGDEFEVGMNLLDVPVYSEPEIDFLSNRTPDVMFNFQKGFELADDIHFALGSQIGVAASTPQDVFDFSTFDWLVLEKEVEDIGFFYGGIYAGNRTYLGKGNKCGAMLGLEIPLVKDRFSFQADALTGTNDISAAVIGAVYTFPESHWQLSLGYQVPFPNSGNPNLFVMELTWLPVRPIHDPRNDLGPAFTTSDGTAQASVADNAN